MALSVNQEKLPPELVHGNNILGKLKGERFKENRALLEKVWERYTKWRDENLRMRGISKQVVERRTELLNDYKNFVDKIDSKIFSAQSKFHPSVLEEFLYYLFRELVSGQGLKTIKLGGTRAYSNIYFSPPGLKAFADKPFIRVNEKGQDLAIYRALAPLLGCEEEAIEKLLVFIKCRRHLHKRMLAGYMEEAERIKINHPNCFFIVVTETYEVGGNLDPRCSKINQIYVLRKGRETNPIYKDVVWRLFNLVKLGIEPAKTTIRHMHSNFEKYGTAYV